MSRQCWLLACFHLFSTCYCWCVCTILAIAVLVVVEYTVAEHAVAEDATGLHKKS